jgi:prolyl-tRNA synthetase
VTPERLWETSGRDMMIGDDLKSFHNNDGRAMVLAPMHEEAAVELMRRTITEVDQLPRFLYQFQGKYRDEPVSDQGLVKAREFLMNDAYSFHRSFAELNNFMPRIFAAYQKIFRQMGLNILTTEGAANFTGGTTSYDFLLSDRDGSDTLVRCPNCGYSANRDVAVGVSRHNSGRLLDLEEVHYEDCFGLECMRRKGGLPASRSASCRVYSTTRGFAMAVYRSDKTISLDKLARVIGCPVISELSEVQLEAMGFDLYAPPKDRRRGVSGPTALPFVTPLGIEKPEVAPHEFIVAVDTSVTESSNLIINAGSPGRFYINVNFGRDFDADYAGDFSMVDEDCVCYHCHGPLELIPTIKLASVYRIGEFYTRAFDFRIKDETGRDFFPSMGAYGIGLGRLVASLVEAHQYKDRFIWPMNISPYKAAMIIVGRGSTIQEIGAKIHTRLGRSVLLDDRKIPITRKFKELDKTGIPLRIIVSGQTLDDGKVMLCHPRYAPPERVQLNHLEARVREIEALEQQRFEAGHLFPGGCDTGQRESGESGYSK